MKFFTKAPLIAGIILSSVFIIAGNASAAVFNFTFDNTVDQTVTPPFVGSGTLSFDGTATVGIYSLASLSNLNVNFSFTDGSSYTIADLNSGTNLSLIGISIFDLGSGNLGLVTTGNVLRFKNSSLNFEPTSNINDPINFSTNSSVVHGYINNNVGGNYNAVGAAQQVPEPATILGSLAAFAYAAHSKRKSNLDRSTAKKEFGE
jgi:hypothetical protein